jgi:proton-translocating NADH-quinone oxidoreductase chain M
MLLQNILNFLLFIPLIGTFVLFFIPYENKILLKQVALFFSSITLNFSLLLCLIFDKSLGSFQNISKLFWLPFLNINIHLGIDGISLFFLILTTLLIYICLLASWTSIFDNVKYFLIFFLLMEFFLIGVFCVLDLLIFYIFFECVLIPMFFIIGLWGSRERKIRAAYFFFFFTLFGSVLMLLAIIYMYYQTGTTNFEIILTINFTKKEQLILWIGFFLSFASKVPMIPFHVWLPEAHVEASTTGSVILAGILLKLGTYGLLRFLFPLFPFACFYFTPLVYSLSVIGILYTSITAIRQSDFKRIIAYTSIAHMNLVIVGLFSFHLISIEGAILQSISHGFVSSALFLLIGVVYDRCHTRMVKYYSGLTHIMPLYIFLFLFFTLANIGFPGTSNFIGEFLILLGSFQVNIPITIFSSISMILGGCYSLWLFNRVAYGNLKNHYLNNDFFDLNKREIYYLSPLVICTFFFGIYPEIFLDYIHLSTQLIIEYVNI